MRGLYQQILLSGLLCFVYEGFVCCQSNRIKKPVLESKKKQTAPPVLKKSDTLVTNPPILYNRLNSEIGPEDIRVVARVLSIRNSDHSLEVPCNQFRCTAEIVIEEVIQKGRTYSGNLEVGKMVTAFFPMTLEPTLKAFPGTVNQEVFPGLNLNELFMADVSGAQAIDHTEIVVMRILTYKSLK